MLINIIIFQNVGFRNMEFLETSLLPKEFAVSLLVVSGNDPNTLGDQWQKTPL